MQLLLWILALILVSCAGWLDWRTRRIPNWLTVPALFAGIAFNVTIWRWVGAKNSLEGAGIALGVLLPFVLVRGLGAGDWKLMGALGAWLGPANIILALLGTVFVAGIMGAVQVIRAGCIKQTFQNMWSILLTISTFGVRSSKVTLDTPGLLALPFGVAAAVATTVVFCAELVYRHLYL
jgi:prepilin peptidase CpaA